MELADAIVRHKGKLTTTIPKFGLTPPEVVLLQHIHGNDAVVDLTVSAQGKVDRDEFEELDRLRNVYGVSGDNLKMIAEIFPGHSPSLPMTFKQLGIELGRAVTAGEKKRSGKGRTAAAVNDLAGQSEPEPEFAA